VGGGGPPFAGVVGPPPAALGCLAGVALVSTG
jgi:hypothetical protein